MRRLRVFLSRLRGLIHARTFERDLTEEIAAHLAEATDEYVQQGLSPAEARLAALRSFGGIELMKERHRDARSLVWLDDARRDVHHAARLLRRRPLFTVIAALSLAIGIGANTTIFTVTNGLLFHAPAGVVESDRLVDIGRTDARIPFNNVSYPNYLDIRHRVSTLEGVYAYQPVGEPMSLGGSDGAERIFGNLVTTNYFAVLGVRAAVGRLIGAGDSEQPGASPFVVLSYRFWTRRFNADPAIIGQVLQINGHPFAVVGVASEGFQGTTVIGADVWMPTGAAALMMPEEPTALTNRGSRWLVLGGRLKQGVRVPESAAELDTIGRALERDYPDANRGEGLRLVASSPIPGNMLPVVGFLVLLAGIVSLVLAVACANVAGMLLARATARRREIAVRLAMGAGRARLIRQLLTETVLLFLMGGAAGLGLARGLTSLLVSRLPTLPFPVEVSLTLDRRALAFTTGLSLIAALLSGLVPALQASRADVVSTLKDDAQGPSDRLRLRSAFVIGQVALSLVLVIGAGLFVRALQRASTIDPGFNPHGVELALVNLSQAGYTETTGLRFARELADHARRVPGVQDATVAALMPMGGAWRVRGLTVPGVAAPAGQPFFEADGNMVEPGYFATLGIPIVAGRDFSDADGSGAPPVAIVSQTAARQFWPGQDAIGKSLVRERASKGSATPSATITMVVVGVARDAKFRNLRDAPRPFLYVPFQQQYSPLLTIAARTTRGQRVARELRTLVASMNPGLPIITAQTLGDLSEIGLVPEQVAASASGGLGLVGLLLAAIGIYGVTAYAVTSRTREIGIRMALGAQRGHVLGMVLGQGLRLAGIGTVVGLTLAGAVSRLLTTWLFGLPPTDPLTFAGAAVLFVAIGLVACYVPAHRATQIDAMEALRYE